MRLQIPEKLFDKANSFPESSYGATTVTLILSDGRRIDNVVLGGALGALAVSAGTAALLVPSLALPRENYSPMTAHLVREQDAGFVFIGLMLFWCLSHFEQRRPVHLALLLFTGLFAAIHWADYVQEHRSVLSPVINTLPVLALAATALFVRRPAA